MIKHFCMITSSKFSFSNNTTLKIAFVKKVYWVMEFKNFDIVSKYNFDALTCKSDNFDEAIKCYFWWSVIWHSDPISSQQALISIKHYFKTSLSWKFIQFMFTWKQGIGFYLPIFQIFIGNILQYHHIVKDGKKNAFINKKLINFFLNRQQKK